MLAAKDKGGIGIGSLNAMNIALLYKWRWRGLNNGNSLWVKVIADIHGSDCFYNMSAKSKGVSVYGKTLLMLLRIFIRVLCCQ